MLAAVCMTIGLSRVRWRGRRRRRQQGLRRAEEPAERDHLKIEAGNFYFKPDKISTNAGIATIKLTAANGIHDLVFDGA